MDGLDGRCGWFYRAKGGILMGLRDVDDFWG